jgi:hypothetical protein
MRVPRTITTTIVITTTIIIATIDGVTAPGPGFQRLRQGR